MYIGLVDGAGYPDGVKCINIQKGRKIELGVNDAKFFLSRKMIKKASVKRETKPAPITKS